MCYDVVVIAAGSTGNVLATHLSFVSILESAVG
jgi:choline dehydrogenase-like flavoprotein